MAPATCGGDSSRPGHRTVELAIVLAFKDGSEQWFSLMELMTGSPTRGIGSDDPGVLEIVADPSDAYGNDGERLTV